MPVAAIAGAVVGGIAGGQRDVSNQTQNGRNDIYLQPESELQKAASEGQLKDLNAFSGLVNAGANQKDVSQAASSQRSLADLLQQYSQGGFLPNQGDINTAQNLGNQLFAPQFRQQGVEASRQAARMGRPVNDPILQAKLRQGQADTMGQFVANYSQQLPMQRLGFASPLSDVRNSLSSQAMSNRQALLAMGGNILGQQQNFQLGTAAHGFSGETVDYKGGGFKGIMNGAIAGAGSFMKMGAAGGGGS